MKRIRSQTYWVQKKYAWRNRTKTTIVYHQPIRSAQAQTSFVTSHADDANAPMAIQNPEDIVTLQNELNIIYQWVDLNNMKFNV